MHGVRQDSAQVLSTSNSHSKRWMQISVYAAYLDTLRQSVILKNLFTISLVSLENASVYCRASVKAA